MTWLALLKLGMFQIVWLSCAIGASYGWSSPGIVAVALLLAFHLASAPHWQSAAATVLAAGTFGFVAESSLVIAGFIRYSAPWPTQVLAPPWIVALWLAFGTTLETTRHLLGSRVLVKSAFLGLAAAPLAYLAGERIGALAFSQNPRPGYLAVAILWGIALPALLLLAGKFAGGNDSSRLNAKFSGSERHGESEVT